MTLPRFWVFLAIALPVVASLVAGLSTVDLTYHLRAGSDILATGRIAAADSWTYTVAGQPWFDQGWGAQVVLALVAKVGGWTGLALLRAGLVGLIAGCLFLIAKRAGLPERRAGLLTVAAFLVIAPALALRPQLLGMALFAGVLLLLADRRAHPGRCWAIPLLVLCWANIHGSFFLGPLVVGLGWVADARDRVPGAHRLLAIAIVAAAAACVTPFGPAVWTYAASLSVDPIVTQRISEWQRTSLADPAGVLFALSAVAVGAVLIVRRAAVRWPMVLWLAVFAAIAIYAVRGVAWWGLAVVPVVAALIAADERARLRGALGTRGMRRLNLILVALIIATAIAFIPIWRPVDPVTGAPAGLLLDAPLGVTAAVRRVARPGDHLFAPEAWGSWFEYALPDLPVAVDSRIELFPSSVWAAYDSVASGRGDWQSILQGWGVAIAVVGAADHDLATRLAGAGWISVYSGEDGAVFTSVES